MISFIIVPLLYVSFGFCLPASPTPTTSYGIAYDPPSHSAFVSQLQAFGSLAGRLGHPTSTPTLSSQVVSQLACPSSPNGFPGLELGFALFLPSNYPPANSNVLEAYESRIVKPYHSQCVT